MGASGSAPLSRHPLFERNVLGLVLCFFDGRQLNAFDELQAHAHAQAGVFDVGKEEEHDVVEPASASSRKGGGVK